jgi:hypothetical protein
MRFKRRRLFFVALLVVCALVGAAALLLLQARPKAVELSLLAGKEPDLYYPERRDPDGGGRFSQRIYFLEMPFEEAVAIAEKELVSWGPFSSSRKSRGWIEAPQPFDSHGRRVEIYRNRYDPIPMKVLGRGPDSKTWVTVAVVGSFADPSLWRGTVRLVTGNKRP